jgi:hypothetical protein
MRGFVRYRDSYRPRTGDQGRSSIVSTDSLISFWKLDEASGTRADAYGSNTLTDNNSVGQDTGIVGSAGVFNNASSRYLSLASNASLQAGDVSFSFSCWVYLFSKTTYRWVFAKDSAVAGEREYYLIYDQPSDRWEFGVFRATDSPVIVRANTLGSPAINTWVHIGCYHDAANDQIGICGAGGPFDTQATGGPLQPASNAEFRIGHSSRTATLYFMDGRIDEVGFWKRVLTPSEWAALYNGGAGRTYPF